MADPAVVKEWLAKADEDFLFAEANLREGSEFYAQLCFHFQQAAEKYLKAYIISHNLPFDRVHDLVMLLKSCASHNPDFAELREECILLNTVPTSRPAIRCIGRPRIPWKRRRKPIALPKPLP